MSTSTSTSLANRHIAKVLNNVNKFVSLPHLAKSAIMQEMHWLAEDVERDVLREYKAYDKEYKESNKDEQADQSDSTGR